VVLNGQLSSSSSHSQILFSGLDAVSHCVETLWNKHINSWSSSFAVSGITSILEVFPKILSGNGSDNDWQVMQESAMFAGLAISQNHTAIAHAISYPLTANFQVPHGLACSFSIPNIWRSTSASTKSKIKNFDLINDAATFIDSLLLDQIMAKYVSDVELHSVAKNMLSPDRAGNFVEKIDALWIEKFLDTYH
jgi:alcohol dehydrogenase